MAKAIDPRGNDIADSESSSAYVVAVRDSSGRFKDIQTYERAHRADLAKTSKSEKTARKKAGSKTAKKR